MPSPFPGWPPARGRARSRALDLVQALALAATVALPAGAALGGCGDPLRERAIAALGPEDPSVPPGPRHRPDQPCLTCHDITGTASPMTIAGTIYRARIGRMPARDVEVLVTDAARATFITRSNCAGNFFVYPSTFRPKLPIWASVRSGDRRLDMESPMHKDGDCGACHQDPSSPASAGHVFLIDGLDSSDGAPAGCADSAP